MAALSGVHFAVTGSINLFEKKVVDCCYLLLVKKLKRLPENHTYFKKCLSESMFPTNVCTCPP